MAEHHLLPDELALAELELGPSVGWDESSRFGGPGRLARRALQRALRPYLVRRRTLDTEIVQSLRMSRQRSELQSLADLAGVPPEDAVEVETDVGALWLDRRDKLITPMIEETANWEGDVTRYLTSVLRPGMVFVDVGANVGYFSVLASRLVGRTGTVVSIEPEPRTLQLLRANLWRNGCTNAVVLPIAATSTTGRAQLVQNEVGLAGSSLEERPGEGTLAVPSAALDELLAGWRVDVLKVDIERHEHLALQGAATLVHANPSAVAVCEFWPHAPQLPGDLTPEDVLAFYASLGLELCLLEFNGTAVPASTSEIRAREGPLMNIVLRGPEAPK